MKVTTHKKPIIPRTPVAVIRTLGKHLETTPTPSTMKDHTRTITEAALTTIFLMIKKIVEQTVTEILARKLPKLLRAITNSK